MELSDTYSSVLEILRDHPDGLRSAEIATHAKKRRMLLIRNAMHVCNIIFALRNKKLVTSSNAHGGKINKITQQGVLALQNQTIEEEDKDGIELATLSSELATEPPNELATYKQEQSQIQSISGLIQGFDEAVSIIRDAMLKSFLEPSPKVADKQRKISVLQRLEMMMSEDISDVLAEIRADLERFEEI